MSEGRKYDDGKARWDLAPGDALTALVDLYTTGANGPYGPRNWEQGMRFGRVFAAAMRHAWAFWRGERYDKESGSHHAIAAAWNLIALYCYDTRGVGTDDRPGAIVGVDMGKPEPQVYRCMRCGDEAHSTMGAHRCQAGGK